MSLLDVPRASLVLNARTTVRQTVPGHMSNAEFSALSLHTKDWEHFPNANMQVSGIWGECPSRPLSAGLSVFVTLLWVLGVCGLAVTWAAVGAAVRLVARG